MVGQAASERFQGFFTRLSLWERARAMGLKTQVLKEQHDKASQETVAWSDHPCPAPDHGRPQPVACRHTLRTAPPRAVAARPGGLVARGPSWLLAGGALPVTTKGRLFFLYALLNQATQDSYTASVTLSGAQGLASQMLRYAQHDNVPISCGLI